MTAEEKTEQLKANREKLDHEIYVAEKKAKACEDEEKFLKSTLKQYNRKARTHRLCNRGAMLEQYLQKPDYLSDEQVAEFLKIVFHKADVQEILRKLLNESHPENPCL